MFYMLLLFHFEIENRNLNKIKNFKSDFLKVQDKWFKNSTNTDFPNGIKKIAGCRH